jgi:hypothetical protein
MTRIEHNGLVLLELPLDGPLLATEQDALDMIGETYGTGADMIVVPLARLDPGFLDLRSGIAGIFFQKMQNYRLRLAIIGDIAAQTEASKALRDFVFETNRHGNHRFAPDREALLARL